VNTKTNESKLAPEEEGRVNVFEVYGKTADARGWDFMVCKSAKDALEFIESDMDELAEGEEVRIVFRRYTEAQMDDVVYE